MKMSTCQAFIMQTGCCLFVERVMHNRKDHYTVCLLVFMVVGELLIELMSFSLFHDELEANSFPRVDCKPLKSK